MHAVHQLSVQPPAILRHVLHFWASCCSPPLPSPSAFCSNVRAELNKFLTYARGKPDVWVVTPRQLLDWTKNPVPVSKMASFMAKYKCNK